MNPCLDIFAVPLALTLAAELPAAFISGARGARTLALTALVNLLTNPAANLICAAADRYFGLRTAAVIVSEILAVLAEYHIYKAAASDDRFTLPRPFATSLFCNAASFCAGALIL